MLNSYAIILKILEKKTSNTNITLESLFIEDLCIEFLDLLDIILEIEDYFSTEFLDDEVYKIKTVGDLLYLVDNRKCNKK